MKSADFCALLRTDPLAAARRAVDELGTDVPRGRRDLLAAVLLVAGDALSTYEPTTTASAVVSPPQTSEEGLHGAERHVASARASTSTVERDAHIREARSWLARARHELAALRQAGGSSAPPRFVADVDELAREVYLAEQRITSFENGGR